MGPIPSQFPGVCRRRNPVKSLPSFNLKGPAAQDLPIVATTVVDHVEVPGTVRVGAVERVELRGVRSRRSRSWEAITVGAKIE